MNLTIRLATPQDLPAYTDLLQKMYQTTYTNDALGLTKDCFSKDIFATKDTQNYLRNNLVNNNKQVCYLAFDGEKLVGSITMTDKGHEYELRGFYVDTDYQGQGLGKQLWHLVQPFASKKDIVCDVYAHNMKTIDMYKKWGFGIDTKKGVFFRHWPEWPEGLQIKCLYMRKKQ